MTLGLELFTRLSPREYEETQNWREYLGQLNKIFQSNVGKLL